MSRRCTARLKTAENGGTPDAGEAVDLLLSWGADPSELNSDGKTATEVVGDSVFPDKPSADNAKRVHELLATERR